MIYKNKKCYGFTLLEVMLAVAIIGITLVIVINAFSLIARSKATTSNYTKALFLLEEKINDLQIRGFNNFTQEATFNPPFEKFSWRIKQKLIPSGILKKVSLAVFWKEKGQRKELRIITCL